MDEHINRDRVVDMIAEMAATRKMRQLHAYNSGWRDALLLAKSRILDEIPSADVRPERHGHVVWKERHSGGFRTVKCLYEFPDIIKENNISCKHIAKFDDRCTVKEPYCSECGKRLGDFINFCGNCGALMDGKDV